MKKRLLAIAMMMAMSSFILTACFSENAVEDEMDGAALITVAKEEAEGEEASDTPVISENGNYVGPIDTGIDMNNLSDATVPAAFEKSNINLDTMEITFTVYSQDVYDASQISMLQLGDTLLYNGREFVVESIEDQSGELLINGGFEGSGCNLMPSEGNTYIAHTLDDYATFTAHGNITLPISESIVVSDSINDPVTPKVAGYEDMGEYIEGLEDWSSSYSQYNTTIQIKNSKITAISRIWTP